MMLAAFAGALSGAAIAGTMQVTGMLRERSGLAILLAAIAAFYPVFAVASGAGVGTIALHATAFLGFCALALTGYRRGGHLIAAGIVLHGVFDLAAVVTGHPAPAWWPSFCGALDIVAGGLILFFLNRMAPAS